METTPLSLLSFLLLCGFLASGENPSTKEPSNSAIETDTVKGEKESTTGTAVADRAGARVVHYGERDLIPIRARLRFTTLIILPTSEQILDFVVGDKEWWIVNGAQNFAYVKPAKAGGQTNLNLIAASGNVYSFVLAEKNDEPPDLKVFVQPRDESMLAAANGTPRFVSADQIEDFRKQIEMAKTEAREAKLAAQRTIERETSTFRSDFPTKMRFPYRFKANERPFMVSAIFHDEKFTYIQANPQEVPALYEVKDGKPNLVQYQFRNGTYVVDKILDDGYLAVGRAKMPFYRQQD